MTYRELQKALAKLSESELDNDIIIHDGYDDEYFPIKSLGKTSDICTQLDPGYPILTSYMYE
jgi:hypothetical protein